MDNVRFHHCGEIENFLLENNIISTYLRCCSPGLNPIENFFACVKSRLNEITPKATEKNQLIANIQSVMKELFIEILINYYEPF